MKLINKTSGKVLAENLEVADTFFSKMKGLLGRDNLPEGEALHIIPCNNIHSFFMKFEFDAIFTKVSIDGCMSFVHQRETVA